MSPKFKTLHEAIIEVLKRNRSASFEEIATIIAEENLWIRKSDGTFPKAFQIHLRTTVNKRYKDLFVQLNEGTISIK